MSSAEQRTKPGLTLPFFDEVEPVGFTEAEQQVVLAPMKLRPSKVIEARGGDYVPLQRQNTRIFCYHW
ncbi:hypothetical protein [Arthrobacter sp. BPSS-3]|uniref:hypothetical protein n=1 Tax=Arthrobacter sp. BPSS-3 TaxID=3366580 RepID=UPI0037DC125E